MPKFPEYKWPAGKQSAFCFTVDVDAELPWLWAHRDRPITGLAALELRRFGQRVGIHRILNLLDQFQIRGTFFVPGAVAELYPDLLPLLVEKGHEIGLHGYFHENAKDISDAEFTHALEHSIERFNQQTGITPKGFRSPAWEMTPYMLDEIKRLGLYDSSLMGFDHPYSINGVTEIPVQWTTDDAVYFRYTGGGVDLWPPSPPGPILDGWLDEWSMLHRVGGMFMLTIHDWISGRAQKIFMLEKLLEKVTSEPTVWITNLNDLARHHIATNTDDFNVDGDLPADFSKHPARTVS